MSGFGDDARIGAAENRLTAVEIKTDFAASRIERLEAKIESLTEKQARLEERIADLPRKGFIVTVVVIALTLLGGLFAILTHARNFSSVQPTPANVPSGR